MTVEQREREDEQQVADDEPRPEARADRAEQRTGHPGDHAEQSVKERQPAHVREGQAKGAPPRPSRGVDAGQRPGGDRDHR